jgi:chromosome segregation ATPase
MGNVYESLKVKLQRNKSDFSGLDSVKQINSSSLDEIIDGLVQRAKELKPAIKQREEEIKKETQQFTEFLNENIAILEAKLKDAEESVRRKESVRQEMEERLTSEIHGLQNDLNAEKETLQTRDQEIADLKSSTEVLVKQVTEFEIAMDQGKAEAAAEANRTEQLIEGVNAKVATLEAQLTDTMGIVRGKEAGITALEQKLAAQIQDSKSQLKTKDNLLADRDAEINHLSSKVQVLTGKIQKLSSLLKQAEDLTTVEAENISTVGASEPLEKKPAASAFNVKLPASNEQTSAAQQTVGPELFDLTRQQLAKIMGPQAEVILRDRVAALGETMDSFPKSRLYNLLEILSEDIENEPLRIGFRKWFVKQVYR